MQVQIGCRGTVAATSPQEQHKPLLHCVRGRPKAITQKQLLKIKPCSWGNGSKETLYISF